MDVQQDHKGAQLWLRKLPSKKANLTHQIPATFSHFSPEELPLNPNLIPLGPRRSAAGFVEESNTFNGLPPNFVEKPAPKRVTFVLPEEEQGHSQNKISEDPKGKSQKTSKPDDLSPLAVPVVRYERALFQRIGEELSPFEWEHFGTHFSGYTNEVLHPIIVDQVVQSQMDRYCGGYTLDPVDRKHTKAVMGKCADAKGKFKFHH